MYCYTYAKILKNIVITKSLNNCYFFYYYIGNIFIIDNILININNDLFK